MALTVQDIRDLPSGRRMKLLAGQGGLAGPVISVEIADYEFAPDLIFAPGADFDLEKDLDAGSFIITSFLFAKDDPGLILPAVRRMKELGMAGLAYKQIIYQDLPGEVLDYAEANDFPVFSFGKTVWFENIIFDIMYAVQFDDKVYLSEDKVGAMLSGTMDRSELDIILKGISLKLRPRITAACLSGAGLDRERALRNFYLSKGIRDKALMIRYEDLIFVIITTARDDLKSHRLILDQAMEAAGIEQARPALSGIHSPGQMDLAFRESWYCHIAMEAEGADFASYEDAGVYRLLLPVMETEETPAFARDLLDPLTDFPELKETAFAYAEGGGDIAAAADRLSCHPNTIRYRLGRIRGLTGLDGCTDPELFMYLKLAVSIDRAKAVLSRAGI